MMKVAVIGNTGRNIGVASAADLALAGNQVSFAVFPGAKSGIKKIENQAGIHVEGNPDHLVSGKTGFAKLSYVGAQTAVALKDADVVILDIPMRELGARFNELVPHIPKGAVVHAQTYGCWAASILTTALAKVNRTDILVTEAKAPTTAAKFDGSAVTAGVLRRNLELATIPSGRIDEALARLRMLFPDFTAAPSALQTSLENINLMVHPAMSLLACSMFERAELAGENIQFYRDANSPSAGLLADALDTERATVCAAYGVRRQGLPATLRATYNATGEGSYEAVASCKAYQNAPPTDPGIWREWMVDDIPFGVAPLVLLGEQANVPVRLHRAIAEIFGTILRRDPWQGPSLEDLGLEGRPEDVIARVNGAKVNAG